MVVSSIILKDAPAAAADGAEEVCEAGCEDFAEDVLFCWDEIGVEDEDVLTLSGMVAPMVMNGIQKIHRSKMRQSAAFPFTMVSRSFRMINDETILQLR